MSKRKKLEFESLDRNRTGVSRDAPTVTPPPNHALAAIPDIGYRRTVPKALPPAQALALQRLAGNRAVAALLGRQRSAVVPRIDEIEVGATDKPPQTSPTPTARSVAREVTVQRASTHATMARDAPMRPRINFSSAEEASAEGTIDVPSGTSLIVDPENLQIGDIDDNGEWDEGALIHYLPVSALNGSLLGHTLYVREGAVTHGEPVEAPAPTPSPATPASARPPAGAHTGRAVTAGDVKGSISAAQGALATGKAAAAGPQSIAPEPGIEKSKRVLGVLKEVGTQAKETGVDALTWFANTALPWLVDQLPFVGPIKAVVTSASGLIGKIKRYFTLHTDVASLKQKVDASADKPVTPAIAADRSVYAALTYGGEKTKRRAYGGLYELLSTIAKGILRIITLISGGTSTLVTESIALGITLLDGAKSLGTKLKGLYKHVIRTRGVARATNAKVLVDSAFDNQPEALKLLRALDPFSPEWKKEKTGSKTYPSTNAEMSVWLIEYVASAKKGENRRMLLEKDVAAKLTSH